MMDFPDEKGVHWGCCQAFYNPLKSPPSLSSGLPLMTNPGLAEQPRWADVKPLIPGWVAAVGSSPGKSRNGGQPLEQRSSGLTGSHVNPET